MRTHSISGMAGEATEHVVMVMFDFVGEPVFVHSGLGYVTAMGEDWLGVGSLGRIEPVKDALGYAPSRVRCTLSNPLAEHLNEALNENTWGRLVEVFWTGWENGALSPSTPNLLLRGRMGPPEIYVGEKNEISVNVEDVRAMMGRINGLRSTLLEHQAEVGSDTFYEMLAKMLDYKFVFNGGVRGGGGAFPSIPGIHPNPDPGSDVNILS